MNLVPKDHFWLISTVSSVVAMVTKAVAMVNKTVAIMVTKAVATSWLISASIVPSS